MSNRTCGPPARCVECSCIRPIQGRGLCRRCYQRQWSRTRRHVPKTKPPEYAEKGGRTVYAQAIVRVPNMPRGWGCL
jgi:hypothetical protein